MSLDVKAVEVIEIFSLIKQYYKSLGFKKSVTKQYLQFIITIPEEDLYALFRIDAQLIRVTFRL
jgi:hypothetical protein